MLKQTLRWTVALLLLIIAMTGPSPAADVGGNIGKAKVNGVELGYSISGKGRPLLLITGYGATMDSWDHELIEKLEAKFLVIVFDNRGMGYSAINDEKLTVKLMADDAAGLLDALKIKKADVLGWSMGSMIAQEVALDYPEKVGKVILYATACTNQQARDALVHVADIQALPPAERYFTADWAKNNPGALSRLPKPAIPPSAVTAAKQAQACKQWPGSVERLTGLNMPVLVLVGENDRITPVNQSVQVAGLVPGAWLARFRGGTHFLQYQAPADFARTVITFLETNQNLIEQAN